MVIQILNLTVKQVVQASKATIHPDTSTLTSTNTLKTTTDSATKFPWFNHIYTANMDHSIHPAAVDKEIARLMFQLMLEDADGTPMSAEEKGKGREETRSDFQVAMDCLKADLASSVMTAADRSIAESLDADATSGSNNNDQIRAAIEKVLATAAAEDEGTWGEHFGTSSASEQVNKLRRQAEIELLRRWAATYDGEDDDAPADGQPESSAQAASRKPMVKFECNSCIEKYTVKDIARTTCTHTYCRGCLQHLFTTSLSDVTLFPPRCCQQPIDADTNRMLLTEELYSKFQDRKVEMDTPNPVYCHNTDCSRFIPPQFIENMVAYCRCCHLRTCAFCKAAQHDGECQGDEAVQQTLEMAEQEGWRQCNDCGRVIELTHGCNHITCHCGAQFCYLCGMVWKTCPCEQFTLEHLLDQGREIWGRDQAAGRNVDLQQVIDEVVQNHRCERHDWKYLKGRNYSCQQCLDRGRHFIMECTRCRMLACRACAFHRI